MASIYVCGITPYDATHLGHAATYLAFDSLIRLWLDAGVEVRYVQNSTDVDDPLLERAARDGVDWRELAAEQTDLFRHDMEELRIIPPDHYVAVTEVIDDVAAAVSMLLGRGIAYQVESLDAAADLYFDSSFANSAWHLGIESNFDLSQMLTLSAERGGDPGRPGKRHPLDPVLWRAERAGEPAWDSVLGRGRPGWHIECSAIALKFLPPTITVNGGGSDLLFPHHEFTAGHTAALTGNPLAETFMHAGQVAFRGEKMSKSVGNLVFVSDLIADGADRRAIRLAILAEHYRSDWEWTDARLTSATQRLDRWRRWADTARVSAARVTTADPFVDELRGILAEDLDTPGAVAAIDARIAAGGAPNPEVLRAIDALLGVSLTSELTG